MDKKQTYQACCHCGTVQITLEHRPEFINDCNCSLCSKSGAIWGYFTRSSVTISDTTQTYVRHDRSEPAVRIHFCTNCGSTTHWTLTDSYVKKSGDVDRMGVNMRLFDPEQLSGIEVRFPDGKGWSGSGSYGYRRDPMVLE